MSGSFEVELAAGPGGQGVAIKDWNLGRVDGLSGLLNAGEPDGGGPERFKKVGKGLDGAPIMRRS